MFSALFRNDQAMVVVGSIVLILSLIHISSGESEAMIEEFMLLANQCAAHFARVGTSLAKWSLTPQACSNPCKRSSFSAVHL